MIYLTEQQIVAINTMLIRRYSPKEPIELFNQNSLKMAVEQPKQAVFGKEIYPTIYDKAAILLINIVKKHPFANANKRTGFMSAHVFLKVNGYELNADQESSEQLTVKVATFIGDFEVLKSEVAHFFKKYTYLKE